jgi:hypothetical protein
MSVTVVDAGPHQISRTVEVQAPAPELFAIVADPTRHHEVDGSGTVRGNIRAPAKFVVGARLTEALIAEIPEEVDQPANTRAAICHGAKLAG